MQMMRFHFAYAVCVDHFFVDSGDRHIWVKKQFKSCKIFLFMDS